MLRAPPRVKSGAQTEGTAWLQIKDGAELCTAAIKAAKLKDSQKSFPEQLIHGHRARYEGAGAD